MGVGEKGDEGGTRLETETRDARDVSPRGSLRSGPDPEGRGRVRRTRVVMEGRRKGIKSREEGFTERRRRDSKGLYDWSKGGGVSVPVGYMREGGPPKAVGMGRERYLRSYRSTQGPDPDRRTNRIVGAVKTGALSKKNGQLLVRVPSGRGVERN